MCEDLCPKGANEEPGVAFCLSSAIQPRGILKTNCFERRLTESWPGAIQATKQRQQTTK